MRLAELAACGLASLATAVLLVLAWDAAAANLVVVSQRNRLFQPREVEIAAGGVIRFENDDGQLMHHVHLTSPRFSFDTGEQLPGNKSDVRFTTAGQFTVLCGIHPKMRLTVTVR